MASKVYWGSPRQSRLEASETLPAKLDLILERLHLRDRVKDELVAVKMHTGNNLSYSTIHPLFVRKVVQAIKDGGGKPFVVDVEWDVKNSEERGYSTETLGCPIYPGSGPADTYSYPHERPFRQMKTWRVAGLIEDATFLVNFAHIKGHPSCGFGGAFKNLALGCMAGETRRAMHDTCHYARYWFPEKCPDVEMRKKIVASCPFGALVFDKDDANEIHLHVDECNQCGRCLKVAPEGSLKIDPANFYVFQEACANSVDITLSTFKPGKYTHLALATQQTPVCDCFGFTGMSILPDAGIFGSDDIVALDSAVLDMTGKSKLIEENIPTSLEVHTRKGHPYAWLHGPLKDPYKVVEYGAALGLGSREYELIDVLPVEEFKPTIATYIAAK
ncbi:MAG: DUF362 domain-containing protein [Anaerolineaceae bacterium]